MKKLIFLIIGISLLFSWDLKINKNDIIVYTQKVNGSKYEEFKAEILLKAPYEKVKKALLDFKNYPKWQKKISHIEVKNGYMLKILDFPFPFSDRFAFYKIQTREGDGLIINLKSIPHDKLPENIKKEFKKPDEVEMKDDVTFTLKKTNDGVLLTYRAKVDPNGAPAFIFNSKIPGAAYETLNNFRVYLKEMK